MPSHLSALPVPRCELPHHGNGPSGGMTPGGGHMCDDVEMADIQAELDQLRHQDGYMQVGGWQLAGTCGRMFVWVYVVPYVCV